MIKFFRKIRQRLLFESKFSKYLLYALGEIVLVVIGILIALQINTWNEHRKVRRGIDEQLHSMTKELEQDILFYKDLIERDVKRIEFIRSLISGTYDTLEIRKAPGLLSFNYDKRAFGTAYQTLKESGETNMIDDATLIQSMFTYYEGICVDFNNRSDWHKQFVTGNVEPYIMTHLPMDSIVTTNPQVVISELPSIEFQNILSIQLWSHKRTDRHATKAITSAEQLIESIIEEIEGS